MTCRTLLVGLDDALVSVAYTQPIYTWLVLPLKTSEPFILPSCKTEDSVYLPLANILSFTLLRFPLFLD